MITSHVTRQAVTRAAYALNGIDISKFHPSKGLKYSPNLYAFLASKKHWDMAKMARVFVDSEQVKWLGYFDDTEMFVGERLSLVLCYGAKAATSCPVNLGLLTEIKDFWAQYAEIGRCAIDTAHTQSFINSESRWKVSGTSRECLWCGNASQHLKKWTEQVIREREAWVSVEPRK